MWFMDSVTEIINYNVNFYLPNQQLQLTTWHNLMLLRVMVYWRLPDAPWYPP